MNRSLLKRDLNLNYSKKMILRWTGQGKAFKGVYGPGPEMTMDGSGETGPSPMDSLLLGLMGCMGIDLLFVLNKSRVDVGSLEIHASAERNHEPPQYFKRVHLTFVLGGVDSEARPKVDRALQLSRDKYCSVFHSLRQDLDFETVVEGL